MLIQDSEKKSTLEKKSVLGDIITKLESQKSPINEKFKKFRSNHKSSLIFKESQRVDQQVLKTEPNEGRK